MLFHGSAFLQGKWACLLQNSCWESHLSDVVEQPGEVGELLIRFGESHSLRDVARIDGNCSRVARRVFVASIERGNQCTCERKTGGLEPRIRGRELRHEL